MKIALVRHGETEWNRARRYLGCATDQPLTESGAAALSPANFAPDRLVVSPMQRARQTAALLFPQVKPFAEEPRLREMDFGVFEGRSAAEMAEDPDYAAWLDTLCEGVCPGGESRAQFAQRCRDGFADAVESALKDGVETLAVVAHGGTLMAVLSAFARPKQDYFSWQAENGCGWLCETDAQTWRADRAMQLLCALNCRKSGNA